MEYYKMRADVLPKIRFVDETVICPPYVHKRRTPGEYIIYAVKSGEMFLEEDGVSYTLREGDVCVLDRDRTHAGTKASTCGYYYIHFQSDSIELVQETERKEVAETLEQLRQKSLESKCFEYEECEDVPLWLPKHFHVDDIKVWAQMDSLLKQAAASNTHQLEGFKVLCACRVQEALILLSRCFLTQEREKRPCRMPAYYPMVQKLQEFLNREYASEITGERLEKELGGSFDYMNRVFKKVTGQTIFSYLTDVRISRAKVLILHTPMRMREICERVGYPDVYYFSRVFKKNVGMPPAAFARAAQADEKVAVG